MAKRLADDRDSDLTEEGYIVGVSPVKISRSNNKYFNGKMQTEHKTYNFVCFAAEKAAEFQAAEDDFSYKIVQHQVHSIFSRQRNVGHSNFKEKFYARDEKAEFSEEDRI